MARKSAGKKPEYNISVLNKETDERGRIGAGWTNPDGSISIKFDYLIHIPDDRFALIFTLFLNDGDEGFQKRMKEKRQREGKEPVFPQDEGHF